MGIDVSHAQGDNIDWHKVKKSGVDFVCIRAGFRDAFKVEFHKDTSSKRTLKLHLMQGSNGRRYIPTSYND